jgi:2Fe-2S ferredoxin
MVKITFVTHAGDATTVEVSPGTTLMEAAIQNGLDGIEAVCGGNCYCGTCRIHVDPKWMDSLVPAAEEELAMIEAAEDDNPYARLACQVPVTEAMDGIQVTTPEFQK